MKVHELFLIEEVRKRPELWMKKRKKNADKLWAEVGNILDADAAACRRTWQILRIRFGLETKRILERMAKSKENGTYNPKNKYTSWHLFDALRFLEIVQSRHRKRLRLSDNPDVKTAVSTRTNAQQAQQCSNRKCIEDGNSSNENNNANLIIPIYDSDDSGHDIKNFDSDNLNSFTNECGTLSNENAAYHSNTFCKIEPELQTETDTQTFQKSKSSICLTPQQSHCFEAANIVKDSIKVEIPDQSTTLEERYSSSPDVRDENYSFLHSFSSQTKLMSQSQKMEFRIKMKNLLLYIFPASSSVDILENQLLLSVDDMDNKFLISFLPFMKSMSLTQNLKFRAKVADLVLNSLFMKKQRNFI